jgi:hypothetical protein
MCSQGCQTGPQRAQNYWAYVNKSKLTNEFMYSYTKAKAVPLLAKEALGVRGSIALNHSRPRH